MSGSCSRPVLAQLLGKPIVYIKKRYGWPNGYFMFSWPGQFPDFVQTVWKNVAEKLLFVDEINI